MLGAVDDLAQDLAVDLVVDPSPGAIGASHRRARRVLAGAAYALVPVPDDPPFEASVDEVERVLVTTGAADSGGAGARIATALASSLDETRPEVEIRLVVGPWGARDVPAGVVPVHAPNGLARETRGRAGGRDRGRRRVAGVVRARPTDRRARRSPTTSARPCAVSSTCTPC